jgi:hypothetical protein
MGEWIELLAALLRIVLARKTTSATLEELTRP